MSIAQFLVYGFYGYLLLGLLFGLWFVFRGVQQIDAGMEGAQWNLRLLLLPGSIALWVLLLRKYLNRPKT
ncbi:MAG: hypothetical protein AAGD05_05930 [Bacteroidota bacterium]